MRTAFLLIVAAAAAGGQDRHMTPDDIVKLPSEPAAARITYGPSPQQYMELRLPKMGGPFPGRS